MKKSAVLRVQQLWQKAAEERRCISERNGEPRRLLVRAREEGLIVSPMRGMFALAGDWARIKPDEQARRIMRTLALQHQGWVFCHTSAAVLHGLYVSYREIWPLRVAVGDHCHTRSSDKIMRLRFGDVDTDFADGVRVTSLERTVLDCLADLPFGEALAIADSVLRLSGQPREHFVRYLRENDALGTSRAAGIMSWADGLSESGGESMARAVMIRQGYLLPRLQVRVPDPLGSGTSYRPDFLWDLPDGSQVAGELDGHEKYVDPGMTGGRDVVDVLADERIRESRLSARAGLRVMRLSFADVVDERRLVRVLDAYGIPRGPMREVW